MNDLLNAQLTVKMISVAARLLSLQVIIFQFEPDFVIAKHPSFLAQSDDLVALVVAKHPIFPSLTTPAFTYERNPFESLRRGAIGATHVHFRITPRHSP